MGKLTSLLSGAAGGYMATQRYMDSKDRQKRQDDILAKYLTGGAAAGETEDEYIRRTGEPQQLANGGVVGGIRNCADMPNHYDKMGWQRQSFKK